MTIREVVEKWWKSTILPKDIDVEELIESLEAEVGKKMEDLWKDLFVKELIKKDVLDRLIGEKK